MSTTLSPLCVPAKPEEIEKEENKNRIYNLKFKNEILEKLISLNSINLMNKSILSIIAIYCYGCYYRCCECYKEILADSKYYKYLNKYYGINGIKYLCVKCCNKTHIITKCNGNDILNNNCQYFVGYGIFDYFLNNKMISFCKLCNNNYIKDKKYFLCTSCCTHFIKLQECTYCHLGRCNKCLWIDTIPVCIECQNYSNLGATYDAFEYSNDDDFNYI